MNNFNDHRQYPTYWGIEPILDIADSIWFQMWNSKDVEQNLSAREILEIHHGEGKLMNHSSRRLLR